MGQMLIRHDDWSLARVYVDDEALPAYMGVSVRRQERGPVDSLRMFFPPNTVLAGDTYETWLTKLAHRHGVPWKYVSVCRLFDVDIRVEIEERTVFFRA